jgi:hypothetical protein
VVSAPGCAWGRDGRLFFGRTTAIFDNLNRHVQIIKEFLGSRSGVFRYDEIDNVGVEQHNNEETYYRVHIELADGRGIGIGSGASCSQYEIEFVVRQLSAHSGLRRGEVIVT